MAKILYFVVEKQLHGDDVMETTGWKTITVYEIINNVPKIFCNLEAKLEDNTVNEIRNYLDENGHSDETFKFLQL